MNNINDFLTAIQQAEMNGESLRTLYQNVSALASSGKTSLGLNRWVDTDKPKMEDFNQDNEILDREIATLKDNKANLAGADFTGNVSVPFDGFKVNGSDNSAGGRMTLAGTSSIDGDLVVNVFNQYARFYESGGSVRGAALDITSCAPVVNSRIWHSTNLPVETGEWTPIIVGETIAGSYSYNTIGATYYRLGSMCFIYFALSGGVINTAGSGRLNIKGLPIPAIGFSTIGVSFQNAISVPLVMQTGGQLLVGSSVQGGAATVNNLQTGFGLYASGWYSI